MGRASYAVLYAVARVILEAGSSLIVESNFVRGTSEQELSPLMREGEALLIHCQTTRDLIARRVRSRAGRHPQHPDDVDEVLQAVDAHRHDPLELRFPLLIVDTSEGYRPGLDEVLRFCRGDI